MHPLLVLGLAATGLTLVPRLVAGTGPGVRAVPAAQAAPLLDAEDTVVLDVRSAPEVLQARLPGEALNLDFHAPDFPDRVAELDRDASYLLYCRSGQRSGHTRRLMEQLGFVDVTDISDGIIGWVDAGLPVEHG